MGQATTSEPTAPEAGTRPDLSRRPIAVVGAPADFESHLPNVVATALSADTAIRSGFDVFLVETPPTRREAQELIYLSEEAGVRVALPRGLRTRIERKGSHALVSLTAGVQCSLSDLVDLALWLAGSPGVQRLEAFRAEEAYGLSLRAHSGALLAVHRSARPGPVCVTLAAGPASGVYSCEWDPVAALRRELVQFAGQRADSAQPGPPEATRWVSLEDSLEVASVLERVQARVR